MKVLPSETGRRYLEFFRRFPSDVVAAAVEALALSSKFFPNLAELNAAVNEEFRRRKAGTVDPHLKEPRDPPASPEYARDAARLVKELLVRPRGEYAKGERADRSIHWLHRKHGCEPDCEVDHPELEPEPEGPPPDDF